MVVVFKRLGYGVFREDEETGKWALVKERNY